MDKKKRIIDWIIKIALIVIIILLLIHNCELTKKNNNIPSGGNVDIIEIICNNNVCNKKIESLSFAQNKVSIKKGETINLIVIIKPLSTFCYEKVIIFNHIICWHIKQT